MIGRFKAAEPDTELTLDGKRVALPYFALE